MFFSRNKQQDTTVKAELTDGVEAKVAAFMADLKALPQDRQTDGSPLQLLTTADEAFFADAVQAEIEHRTAQLDEMNRSFSDQIAAKDAEIGRADREIAALRDQASSQPAEIERLAKARAGFLDAVRRIDPNLDASDMPRAADVRREVVRRKLGDAAVKGRTEAYIDARFETLEAQARVDSIPVGRAAAEKAYRDMVADLNKTCH